MYHISYIHWVGAWEWREWKLEVGFSLHKFKAREGGRISSAHTDQTPTVIRLRWFCTLHHAKSPSDHYLGEYVFVFSYHFEHQAKPQEVSSHAMVDWILPRSHTTTRNPRHPSSHIWGLEFDWYGFFGGPNTWRIIPLRKLLVTPIYQAMKFAPFGRGPNNDHHVVRTDLPPGRFSSKSRTPRRCQNGYLGMNGH